MRAVNFYLTYDDKQRVLTHATTVLRLVSSYDVILFNYFEDLSLGVVDVLHSLESNTRAQLAYLNYLCSHSPARADEAWQWLERRGLPDDPAAVSYTSVLIRGNRASEAAAIWARHKHHTGTVFNRSFEHPPVPGAPFDWQIAPNAAIRNGALAIHFDGAANIVWAGVRQYVWLPAGSYSLSAKVRAENITTDQGPYLRLCDARTDQLRGTTGGWTHLTTAVVLPRDTLCELAVARDRSRKIDSKIAGRLWIDEVEVTRAAQRR
jgi:hypothetical protein